MDILDHGEVELIHSHADDRHVLAAMLISTGKDNLEDLRTEIRVDADDDPIVRKNRGRINYLMRNKHGTPFEHNFLCFRVTAPIFVIREWHRHRIGWSYNEQSARYMELGDKWYIPDPENVRTRVGKPGHYTYEPIHEQEAEAFIQQLESACSDSYRDYKSSLEMGIAPEQARMFLHVNHYSSFYASCNARSLMKFLELRGAGSTAQWEIRRYADALEKYFDELMPVTYQAFVDNGRIAP